MEVFLSTYMKTSLNGGVQAPDQSTELIRFWWTSIKSVMSA